MKFLICLLWVLCVNEGGYVRANPPSADMLEKIPFDLCAYMWGSHHFVTTRPGAAKIFQKIDKKLKPDCLYALDNGVFSEKLGAHVRSWMITDHRVNFQNWITEQASDVEKRKSYFNDRMEVVANYRQGIHRVCATQPLPAFIPLGIHSGVYSSIKEENMNQPTDEMAEWRWQNLHRGRGMIFMSFYRHILRLSLNSTDSTTHPEPEFESVWLNAYGHLSPIALVQKVVSEDKRQNVVARWFYQKGQLPVLVMFTNRKIEKGETLFMPYPEYEIQKETLPMKISLDETYAVLTEKISPIQLVRGFFDTDPWNSEDEIQSFSFVFYKDNFNRLLDLIKEYKEEEKQKRQNRSSAQ